MKYKINGKTYIQKPLVMGQIRQLMAILNGLAIPQKLTTAGLVALMGERLPQLFAIVLTEEGATLKGKDIEVLAAELEFDTPMDIALQVVDDFFDCNQISLLLERLATTIGKATGEINKATGSKTLSAPSAKEISPEGTTSSGDIPLESASPI